jgi:GT2 family glycosyltransferase
MRERVVVSFVTLALAAIVAVLVAGARDERTLAFTLGVAPSQRVVALDRGERACQEPIEVAVPFAALTVATRDFSGSARILVRDHDRGTRLTEVRVGRDAWNGRVISTETAAIGAGRLISVCVTNLGRRQMHLLGGIHISALYSATYVRGKALDADFAVAFQRAEPRSLLRQLPQVFERASLLRWPWLEPWMLWMLGVLVFAGIPVLIARGLREAADDTTGEAPQSPGAPSYRVFIRDVEPALLARPRVHRAGVPAIVGEHGGGLEEIWAVEAPADPAELQSALGAARAPLVVLLNPGSQVSDGELERLARAAALAPDASVITCDEDQLGRSGTRERPRLHPGPAPDHLLAAGEEPGLLAMRRSRVSDDALRLSGPAPLFELLLRAGGPDGSGHAHVPQILCHRERDRPAGAGPSSLASAARSALAFWGEPAARIEATPSGRRRVRRAIAAEPTVEIIIPFRDRPALLERCVDGLLRGTDYERLSVQLVDNGSTDAATRDLLGRLSAGDRVSVSRDERDFNFSALCNAAARRSSADVLVFLNNDTEVIEGDESWVTDMLEEACRPQVGAVAPLLLYDDGTVQHAGAALGLHGYAGHPFAGLSPGHRTPFGAAEDGTRNWTAVSAACLMVERGKFNEVGGFDEGFTVAGNDVDLCLRLARGGYRSLCMPHARLIHHESRSRGGHIDPGDFPRSEASYGEFRTVGDPMYNPNLTLLATDCSLRRPGE